MMYHHLGTQEPARRALTGQANFLAALATSVLLLLASLSSSLSLSSSSLAEAAACVEVFGPVADVMASLLTLAAAAASSVIFCGNGNKTKTEFQSHDKNI